MGGEGVESGSGFSRGLVEEVKSKLAPPPQDSTVPDRLGREPEVGAPGREARAGATGTGSSGGRAATNSSLVKICARVAATMRLGAFSGRMTTCAAREPTVAAVEASRAMQMGAPRGMTKVGRSPTPSVMSVFAVPVSSSLRQEEVAAWLFSFWIRLAKAPSPESPRSEKTKAALLRRRPTSEGVRERNPELTAPPSMEMKKKTKRKDAPKKRSQ